MTGAPQIGQFQFGLGGGGGGPANGRHNHRHSRLIPSIDILNLGNT
jgi:hypothetical protein